MKKFSLATGVLLLILSIFTSSCVNKEYQVVETYYETEYRTETYTEPETVVTPISGADILKYTHREFYLDPKHVKISWEEWYKLPQHKTAEIKIATAKPFAVYFTACGLDASGTPFDLKERRGTVDDLMGMCDKCRDLIGTVYIYDVTGFQTFRLRCEASYQIYTKEARYVVNLFWTDEKTETNSVTKERQVPYQVEKQRTVIKTKKVPIWELIFHKQ